MDERDFYNTPIAHNGEPVVAESADERSPTMATNVELSHSESNFLVGTVITLCLILGALYGAWSKQRQQYTELSECEERTRTTCVIVVVPVAQRSQGRTDITDAEQ